MKRLTAGWAATALVFGALGAASLGMSAGVAQADLGPAYGPHHWCPGDRDSTAPTPAYNWDWNICHT
ncbi:MAG TPA: hypothetical protein VE400_02475 [Mycobacterium sp.]|jgi:hypothetical protein|nr:hypothetical protein [Mycobacterium sp.]